MKCPCEECISLVMCKFRDYRLIINRCSTISDYLFIDRVNGKEIKTHRIRVKIFEKLLKPKLWKLGEPTKTGFIIRHIGENR